MLCFLGRLPLFVSLFAIPAVAQDLPMEEREAAFLFGYSAVDGDLAGLAAGYGEHLKWHRERNDPLTWYAWFVVQGDRIGRFVDGAFGLTFSDFDNRIDPAGDAADATETFLPVAVPEFRRIYRLRRTLSNATPLEDRNPSAMMQVLDVTVQVGRAAEFERALSRLVEGSNDDPITVRFTTYELVTGGQQPSYILAVPVENISDLGRRANGLDDIAGAYLVGTGQEAALMELANSVGSVGTELWQYRADLSLIPE